MVGVSNKPLTAYMSLPLLFRLGPLYNNHSFSFVYSTPIHLLKKDLLEKYDTAIPFSQNGKGILKVDLGSISFSSTEDSSTSLALSAFKSTSRESKSSALLDKIPKMLWAKSTVNIGQIHSTPMIKN